MKEKQNIRGTLTKIRFESEKGDFVIGDLDTKDQGSVTIVGNTLAAKVGEEAEINGHWEDHPRFGKQFVIASLQIILPSTTPAIEKYLSSGLIEGIGPVLARRIVDRFGEKTLDIIDADPGRIKEVEGIGKVRGAQIQNAWQEQRSVRHVMVYLHEVGLSANLATKLFKHYGAKTLSIVRTNPYLLAKEVYGIGFRKADNIAIQSGIAHNSPYRINAGILHILRQSRMEGHVFLSRVILSDRVIDLLALGEALIHPSIDFLVEKKEIILEGKGKEEALFLPSLWKSEYESAQNLLRLNAHPRRVNPKAIIPIIDRIEKSMRLRLAASQRDALKTAWLNKVSVITGGPGTGKTTLVRGICEIGKQLGRRVLLCAPTGRAAKRLSEATRMPAKTIHRLLEYSFKEGFQINANAPLDADMLIIDEASMIDIVLLNAIVSALPDSCLLVFVGDIDQLPSVGPGRVLDDIIKSGVIEVIHLTEIFRQDEQSKIIINAHEINHGRPLMVANIESDFFTILATSPQDAQDKIVNLVTNRIPKAFGLNPFEDIQILSPMHRGEVGCKLLNQKLQSVMTDHNAPSIERGEKTWRVGDKVMQTRNNYDLEIFNGDIGRLIEINTQREQIGVMFDRRLVMIPFSQLDSLIHAYAITIHKSQGSEYRAVIIPILTQHFIMLQRNLLYTAVTRAKELVIIVGSPEAVEIAIKNNASQTRNTRLERRLSRGSPVLRE